MHPNAKDITGMRSGSLVVVYPAPEDVQTRHIKWVVRCDCGSVFTMSGKTFRRDLPTECKECRLEDLTGKVFYRLLVLRRLGVLSNQGKPVYECRCDCGSVARVPVNALKTGNTKSCGCLNTENARERQEARAKARRRALGKPPDVLLTPSVKRGRTAALRSGFTRAVLERDDFTCQWCGKRGGSLNVHHLDKVSEDESAMEDPTRAVSLCGWTFAEGHRRESCHALIHNGNLVGPVNQEMTDQLKYQVLSRYVSGECA